MSVADGDAVDLHDRIASVIRQHQREIISYDDDSCCSCSDLNMAMISRAALIPWSASHVTDVLIRELGLRKQSESGLIGNTRGAGAPIRFERTRYVTDWHTGSV